MNNARHLASTLIPALRAAFLATVATVVATVLLAGAALGQSLQLPASTSDFGGGFEQPEFLPVEEAYPLAVESIDDSGLRLVWQMPAGYYLYQHAFAFEFTGQGEAVDLDVELPPALEREDEYFGLVQVYYDSADVTLRSAAPLGEGSLAVTSQGCADAGLCYPPRTQYFQLQADGSVVEASTRPPAVANAAAPATPDTPTASIGTLLFMMLLAFGGGLILNLMPCVLPVLSLKVLGFACAPPAERHHHGWLYSAGVVISFLLVAGILLGLRSAGQAIGWGFQLQSPGVVIALAYLFVILGLGLSGVIELGNRFMNLGSDLAGQGGASGSFFTGVLAVVVASPCTAPFMGTALGFALVQPPAMGLAVFAALGAGMAAPMLLLSYSEIARRLMPKPGLWMERLKQALAFPLYVTALWLFWVAGRQTGVDVMAATLLGALLIALGLWLWRESWISRGATVLCLLGAVSLASWRPAYESGVPQELPTGATTYSPATLEQLRSAGKPVFVDVTADWCITCLANKRAVLSTDRIQQAFRDSGVVYMVADWTDYDADIADFVASHGRSGIPLYVLYDEKSAPTLLPQILRTQTVLSAIESVNAPAIAAANR